MTLLDSLILYTVDISTIALELYCTSASVEATVDDPKHQSTSLSSTVTTLLNNINVPDDIYILRNTCSIVETMSDDELAKACEMIEGKQITFEQINDAPKVLVKNEKQQ